LYLFAEKNIYLKTFSIVIFFLFYYEIYVKIYGIDSRDGKAEFSVAITPNVFGENRDTIISGSFHE